MPTYEWTQAHPIDCSRQPSAWPCYERLDFSTCLSTARDQRGHLLCQQTESDQGKSVHDFDLPPKCLAYATYGLDRHKIAISKNNAGKTTAESVTYQCNQSEVPCPGLTATSSMGSHKHSNYLALLVTSQLAACSNHPSVVRGSHTSD